LIPANKSENSRRVHPELRPIDVNRICFLGSKTIFETHFGEEQSKPEKGSANGECLFVDAIQWAFDHKAESFKTRSSPSSTASGNIP
jgi:hypothetical protein